MLLYIWKNNYTSLLVTKTNTKAELDRWYLYHGKHI